MEKFEHFNKPKVNNGLQFLYDDEVEAINGYQKVKAEIEAMELPEDLKKEILDKIAYITNDEVEHCEILTNLIKQVNDLKKGE